MIFAWEKEKVLEKALVARCFSPTNIALAKYWGKRDVKLNLPQNSSISATLDNYGSFTTVEFHESFKEDIFILNGSATPTNTASFKKIKTVLDLIRQEARSPLKARIQTENNFPTGAGLASSASGLSALTLAASSALKLNLSREELSKIARQGSGSASRSLFDGFVQWHRGEKKDGSDSWATPIAEPIHWPLKVIIAVVQAKEKKQASTSAMELTRGTSPYFGPWVEAADLQVPLIEQAILKKDFENLALLSESNCLRMHASSMGAMPPVLYWAPETIALMHTVWDLRAQGHHVFFTIDAGPNVVIFYEEKEQLENAHGNAQYRPEDTEKVLLNALKKISLIHVLQTKVGTGAKLL